MMKVRRRTWIKSMGSVLMGVLFSDSLKGGGLNEQKKEDFVKKTTDVLIIGGGTAGIIAAIQSARAGCNTIIEFSIKRGKMNNLPPKHQIPQNKYNQCFIFSEI